MDEKIIDNINDFKIIEKIGGGQFGNVYKVEERKTKKYYAAKVIIREENIEREINAMLMINNPVIIKFKGLSYNDFDNENNKTIIMEYAEKGSLLNLLSKVKKGLADDGYDNTIKQIILIGISYGMMLLSKKNMIHRDLKPDNIVLDKDFYPKITDFGLTKRSNSTSSSNNSGLCGTPLYMSPEVIEELEYSSKSDVYAFGIIMYQVITDDEPYSEYGPDLKPYKLLSKVVEGKRPEFKNPINPAVRNLIEKCWSRNPSERPTFRDLYYRLAFNQEEPINEYNTNCKYYLEDVDKDVIEIYITYLRENTSDQDLINFDTISMKDEYSKLEIIIEKNDSIEKLVTDIIPQIKSLIKKEKNVEEDDNEIIYQEKIQCIVSLYKNTLENRSLYEITNNDLDEKIQEYYNIVLKEYKSIVNNLSNEYKDLINQSNEKIQDQRLVVIKELMENIEILSSVDENNITVNKIKMLQFEKLLFLRNKLQDKKDELKLNKIHKNLLVKDIAQLSVACKKAEDEFNSPFYLFKK